MKTIVTIVIFLGTISISSADLVTTTDGSSYEGEISSVTINTEEEGLITFDRAEIRSVEIGNREEHPKEQEEEIQTEEVLPQEPAEEAQEEKPLKEPEVVEEEKKEETTQGEKPQIIGPQIRGLDEGKYKTY